MVINTILARGITRSNKMYHMNQIIKHIFVFKFNFELCKRETVWAIELTKEGMPTGFYIILDRKQARGIRRMLLREGFELKNDTIKGVIK